MPSATFDVRRAVSLQRRLAGRVVRADRVGRVGTIAGIDVGFHGERGRAAVAVLDARTLEPLETRTAEGALGAPYVPGLLGFRELPLIRRAFGRLARKPDLVVVDGNGVLHPRRFGLACHVGLVLDVPAIGCAKTPFIGEWSEPARGRGAWTPVVDGGERIGAAVRTSDGVRPVFVSVGHRVSLRTAIAWVLRTATFARLPEPIRAAHRAANEPR